MQVKRYLVKADEETGQWLETPSFAGVVDLREWAQRESTPRVCYTTFKAMGHVRALEVLLVEWLSGAKESDVYGTPSDSGSDVIEVRFVDDSSVVCRLTLKDGTLLEDASGIKVTDAFAKTIGLDVSEWSHADMAR